MLLRVLQFLIGAALASGGGWLVSMHRASFGSLLPPGEAGLPAMLLLGLFGVTTGLVLIVSAVHPRPNQKRLAAEKASRESAALQQAEAYYSGRARAADRDWRSGDIPPLAQPAPRPPVPEPADIEPVVITSRPAAPEAPLPIEPAPVAPPLVIPKPATPPIITPPVFPSDATLEPIPRAHEAPPEAARPAVPAAQATVVEDDTHAPIRTALSEGRLDDAEKLLNTARESATGMALAELTALAGDHAIASGRQSHAKWLWRLALKRFGELQAMDSPAARAAAESLRLAG